MKKLIPTFTLPFLVCGLEAEAASFRTKSYLITICLGEVGSVAIAE